MFVSDEQCAGGDERTNQGGEQTSVECGETYSKRES